MRLKKILCPIDFSEGSKVALRTAIKIANDVDASLVLAHVCSIAPELAFAPTVIREVENDAERFLAEATAEAASLGAKRVSSQFLTGIPWSSIVDLLERDLEIGLVVLGTHGRTGISRFLLGSVAERILRHAPCSVLAVRPDAEPAPFTHVLCPIDFSIDSGEASMLAARLVDPNGEITMFHVTELPFTYFGDRQITDVVHDLEASSRRLVDEAAALLRSKVSVSVTARTTEGRFPGAKLLEAIEQDPTIDLIVMGSHGRTGIRRALMGSIAEKTVRHAPCPVLVSRRRPTELN